MAPDKDPKIELIQRALESHTFQVEDLDNGIRVYFTPQGYETCSVDIYVLRNNPRFIRAKFCSNNILADREESCLEAIHSTLQDAMTEIASLEKFHLLGNRGNIQVYYAPLSIIKDSEKNKADLRVTPTRQEPSQFLDIDSKLLRKTMDQIKLPRSSIVRLVITRIFRESVDSSEMKELVIREAQKIVKPSEKALLKQLQEQKLPPSISAIVHLISEHLP